MTQRENQGELLAAGLMLGAGLGGFVDGILLHELLQWHHMVSSKVPPVDLFALKLNMLWDGLFHAFAWFMTVGGLVWLWRAVGRVPSARRTERFLGAMAAGWGLFNVVEGLIDHQLLGIHHVHPGAGQLAWDLAFIGFGAVLCGMGWLVIVWMPGPGHSTKWTGASARLARPDGR
jgi:uncharacterized membrane protein